MHLRDRKTHAAVGADYASINEYNAFVAEACHPHIRNNRAKGAVKSARS